MSISTRITQIEQHLTDDYSVLTLAGADLTNVDKNIINLKLTWQERLLYFINNGTDVVWNNWEKVEGTGETLTLNSTEEAPMKINLKGNTSQETSILPSGYTQVDYIQSSGTQYIDTGFKPNNNTRTIIDFVDNNSGTGFIFGARTGQSNKAYSFLSQNSVNFRFDYGTNQVSAGSKLVGYRYKVDYNKNVCNVYEVETGTTRTNTITEETFNSGYNMYLFNNNTSDSLSQYSYIKLYSCKIYDNGTLVRDFIPCYRNSDNEVGLYDLVNNVFYTNKRIGEFTYGAVATLPNPDFPQDIHVVSGDNEINVVGKNLLKLDFVTEKPTFAGLTFTHTDSTFTLSGTTTGTWTIFNLKNILPIENNEIYTFSANVSGTNPSMMISIYLWNKTGNQIGNFRIDKNNNYTLTKQISFSGTGELTLSYCTFVIENLTNNSAYNLSCEVQLERNNTKTTYEPYQGTSYPINLPIENLINPSLFTISGSYNVSSITNGEVVGTSITGYAGVRIALGQNVSLKTNDVIYVRLKIKSDVAGDIFSTIQLFNPSNTVITYTSTKLLTPTLTTEYQEYIMKYVLGTDDTLNKLFIQHKGSSSNVFTIKDIQVSYVNGSYTPYGTTPIELCKIGDYQDYIYKDNKKWYKYGVIGKHVFTGTEGDISLQSINSYGIANFFVPISNFISTPLKCSHLIEQNTSIATTQNEGMLGTANGPYIRLNSSRASNVADFKTWLGANDPSVYYRLRTPVTTEITDTTLISQLEAVKRSYTGQTNINQVNNDLPFILDTTALKQLTQ